MDSASPFSFHLPCCLIMLLLLPFPSHSTDPDPLQDFCVANTSASISVNGFPCKPQAAVTAADFSFDGLSKEGNTSNIYGASVTAANVLTFPGLNTLGMAMNRVDFAPGGINPPHSHPRATETGIVVQGTLLIGFVTTNNVFYFRNFSAGEMFVIPRALVHFQLNVGQGKALAYAAFNSHLPGTSLLPLILFESTPSIPNEVLMKTFQIQADVINGIRSKLKF